MQGINKLLLEIDGVPLVRRSALLLMRAGCADVVIVLGHQAGLVRRALGDVADLTVTALVARPGAAPGSAAGALPDPVAPVASIALVAPVAPVARVRVIEHAGYREGQHGSVLAGLAALPEGFDAAMVVLGDMPLVDEADLRLLIDAWANRRAGCEVLVPGHGGRRGNPVMIGADAVRTILRERPDGGARGFIDAHPERVCRIEMPADHCVFDLDTPEDIVRLEARLAPTAVRISAPMP